jgi:hypothetical protein
MGVGQVDLWYNDGVVVVRDRQRRADVGEMVFGGEASRSVMGQFAHQRIFHSGASHRTARETYNCTIMARLEEQQLHRTARKGEF